MWNYDKKPTEDDAWSKAAKWTEVAAALHGDWFPQLLLKLQLFLVVCNMELLLIFRLLWMRLAYFGHLKWNQIVWCELSEHLTLHRLVSSNPVTIFRHGQRTEGVGALLWHWGNEPCSWLSHWCRGEGRWLIVSKKIILEHTCQTVWCLWKLDNGHFFIGRGGGSDGHQHGEQRGLQAQPPHRQPLEQEHCRSDSKGVVETLTRRSGHVPTLSATYEAGETARHWRSKILATRSPFKPSTIPALLEVPLAWKCCRVWDQQSQGPGHWHEEVVFKIRNSTRICR